MQAGGGNSKPAPAVVGDGVQIFLKPPRRRASITGMDLVSPPPPTALQELEVVPEGSLARPLIADAHHAPGSAILR